ncbi:LysR family transcriptional regulator, partial [Streptomyces doudnae]
MGQVLDIAPLRSLVAVADCGGFHRAAAVLLMTQSAVSQHVRRIVAVVGGPVVERSGRGVAFTELGHRVLGHARGILAAHDAALTDLGAAEEQVLLIGATEHGADVMLPALTAALGERLPNWRLRFRLDRYVMLADALEHGLVDLAVMLDGSGRDPAIASGTLALKWVSGRGVGTVVKQPLPVLMFSE